LIIADIDDAESFLGAINETPAGQPIEIILHTPGGMVVAARQIASALADHDGRVTAVVPHYAMGGGTLIALGRLDARPPAPALGASPAKGLTSPLRVLRHAVRALDQLRHRALPTIDLQKGRALAQVLPRAGGR
jgi:ATP-dependent protease ClpP protease subunit